MFDCVCLFNVTMSHNRLKRRFHCKNLRLLNIHSSNLVLQKSLSRAHTNFTQRFSWFMISEHNSENLYYRFSCETQKLLLTACQGKSMKQLLLSNSVQIFFHWQEQFMCCWCVVFVGFIDKQSFSSTDSLSALILFLNTK